MNEKLNLEQTLDTNLAKSLMLSVSLYKPIYELTDSNFPFTKRILRITVDLQMNILEPLMNLPRQRIPLL